VKKSQIADLKAFVASHAAEGGQLVLDQFSDADYEKLLQHGFKKAKTELETYWQHLQHAGGPSF
jgi:hypothetical protein